MWWLPSPHTVRMPPVWWTSPHMEKTAGQSGLLADNCEIMVGALTTERNCCAKPAMPSTAGGSNGPFGVTSEMIDPTYCDGITMPLFGREPNVTVVL